MTPDGYAVVWRGRVIAEHRGAGCKRRALAALTDGTVSAREIGRAACAATSLRVFLGPSGGVPDGR